MRSTVIVVLSVVLFGALLNSVIQFLLASRRSPEHLRIRLLAAGSSLVTLVLLCILYSGSFRVHGVMALNYWTDDTEFIESVRRQLISADQGLTSVGNALSPRAEQGFRPYPPIWPAVLVAVMYAVRLTIYRVLSRRRTYESAAVTGAVYWSYATAYVSGVAFCIVFVGWSTLLVIAGSAAVIVLILSPLASLASDLVVAAGNSLVIVAARIRTLIEDVGIWSARAAGVVRLAFRSVHAFYEARIGRPLRDKTGNAAKAARDRANKDSSKRLAREEAWHKEHFGPDAPFPRKEGKESGTPPAEPPISET